MKYENIKNENKGSLKRQPPPREITFVETPDKKRHPIPGVPSIRDNEFHQDGEKLSRKKRKQKKILGDRMLLRRSNLESLFWRVAWLQFAILGIGFWSTVIASYDPEVGKLIGFWFGFSDVKVIAAISGTITSFTSVVIGGMMKQYNKQIDTQTDQRDEEKEAFDLIKHQNQILKEENAKYNRRIVDLETQLLSTNLKFSKLIEESMNK